MTLPISSSKMPIVSVVLDEELMRNKGNIPISETAKVSSTHLNEIPPLDNPLMLDLTPTSISYSERLNYRIQTWIYDSLNQCTEETEWLRIAALVALSKSSVTNLVLRVLSAVETAIHSLSLFFFAPFTADRDYTNKGVTLLSRLTFETCDIIRLPFQILKDTGLILISPKHFIFRNFEYAQVNNKHIEANTLNSKVHRRDLNDAAAKAYRRFLDFKKINYQNSCL